MAKKKSRGGRPPVPAEEKRVPFAVRLPKHLVDAFDEAIRGTRVRVPGTRATAAITKTEVVEDAVRRFIAARGRKAKR